MNRLIRSDYLIIGSGLAGLYAAYCASKYGTVSIVTKHTLQTSSTYWAQGGVACAVNEDDSPENHFEDTIKAGRGLCNEEAVKILVNEGPKRINELADEGISFDKSNNGYDLGLEGGHSRRRILHLGGNETGKLIVDFLINKIKQLNHINVYENYLVNKLIIDNNKCYGTSAFNLEDENEYSFAAKVTLIASGGTAGIYKRSTNPASSTGDGISLAYNSGIEIVNMEFIQFHPTAFYTEGGYTFLLSEALRGEGGYLVNQKGERFMQANHQDAELAPRDVVSRAMFNEMVKEKSNHLFLSLKHLDKSKIRTRFNNVYEKSLKYNIDITEESIPITPAAHYSIGGIKTNLRGETSVQKLYAAGEVAHTGVHGANRLASNSLLECIVFSYRAIEDSLKYFNTDEFHSFMASNYYIDQDSSAEYLRLKNDISRIMNDYVGIVREEKSLLKALELINIIDSKWDYRDNEYYSDRLRSLITIAQLITKGALVREETRGCHIRNEYPSKRNIIYNYHQSIKDEIIKTEKYEIE